MSQKTTGGRNNKLVGRDDNSKIYTRIIFISFREISNAITRLYRWVITPYSQSLLIVRLRNEITQIKNQMESLKKEHKREVEDLQINLDNKIDEIQQAKNQVKKAEYAINRIYQDVCGNNTKETALRDETYAIVNRIRQSFVEFEEEGKKREPYQRVSGWLHLQDTINWAEESYLKITQKDPKLIPENLKEGFCKDICGYLDWLKKSLRCAKPLRKSLKTLNRSRSMPLSIPHREAFQYIKQKYHQSLSDKEKLSLRQMIDYLCDHLDD